MCRITINAQGLEVTDSVRRLVESDLGAILEPHGRRVAAVHVRLWEEHGGPAICYIRVDLNPSGGLGLGATEPDVRGAVRKASERVGRAVTQRLAVPFASPAPPLPRG